MLYYTRPHYTVDVMLYYHTLLYCTELLFGLRHRSAGLYTTTLLELNAQMPYLSCWDPYYKPYHEEGLSNHGVFIHQDLPKVLIPLQG